MQHGIERAGNAREEGGYDKGRQLHTAHRQPQCFGPEPVLTGSANGQAERRTHDPPQRKQRDGDDGERQAGEILPRKAETRRHEAGDAGIATREIIPLEQHGIGDLRTGERQHGEIDFGEPDAERAEQEAAESRNERPEEDGGLQWQPRLGYGQREPVGTQPEIGGMTEGHHVAEAHKEIERRGEERKNDDLGQKRRGAGTRRAVDDFGQDERRNDQLPVDVDARKRRPAAREFSGVRLCVHRADPP